MRLNSSYGNLRVAPLFHSLPWSTRPLLHGGEKLFVTFVLLRLRSGQAFVVNFLFSSVSFLVAALPRWVLGGEHSFGAPVSDSILPGGLLRLPLQLGDQISRDIWGFIHLKLFKADVQIDDRQIFLQHALGLAAVGDLRYPLANHFA